MQQLYKFMEDRGESSEDFYAFKEPCAGLVVAGTVCPPALIASPAFTSAGTPINKRPVLGYRNLNLFKLYRLVHKLGGFDNVSEVTAAVAPVSVCALSPRGLVWNRSKVAPCGSRCTRTSGSPYSTQPRATTSNVPTASKQPRRLPLFPFVPQRFCRRLSAGAATGVFSHSGTCMDSRNTAPPPPSPSGWTSL